MKILLEIKFAEEKKIEECTKHAKNQIQNYVFCTQRR